LVLVAAENAGAATNHVAFGTSGLTFSPKNLTINVGDTVIWSGPAGGGHSVTGRPGSDPLCGNAIGISTCTHTFSTAGTFPYICIPHQSSGMTGVVVVVTAPMLPPSVSLASPAAGAVFAAPADVAIQANASDADGSVTNVQFFGNGALLGADAGNPFGIVASNLAEGNYALAAVAVDNSGLSSTSSVVNISVVAPLAVTLSSPVITNGRFQFNYTANAGLRYVIEKSTNLMSWSSITTNTASSGTEKYDEVFDVNFLRFHRVGRLANP
jgi:plastocyanin